MATINILSVITIAENPQASDVIATLSVAGGENGETFTYTLTNDFDDRFEIDGDKIRVKTPSLFNFESSLTSFNLNITAIGNQDTEVTPANIRVDVTDVKEAPTGIVVTGGTVSEDDDVGAEVATLAAVDEDAGDVYTYSLVTGPDGATPTTHDFFDVVGDRILLKASLDDEDIGSYKVFIKATAMVDGQPESIVREVTLTVTDEVETENDSDRGSKVTGTAGADVINGNGGNDKIYGLAGDDALNGGTGNDTLWGDIGNDVLNGGLGKDKLYGGLGADTFVFNTSVKKGHFDQVMDFKASDDTIQISLAAIKAFKVKGPKTSDVQSKKGSDDKGKPDDKGGDRPDKGSTKSVGFDKLFVKGQKLQKKFFNVGTKLNDTPDGSNDYIFYNKKNGFVYLDVDGSGKSKGIEILKVKPGTTLTADDFLFI